MSELKSKEDMANEYFKVQQIANYQKAFEELRNRSNVISQQSNADNNRNDNKAGSKKAKDTDVTNYCCVLL